MRAGVFEEVGRVSVATVPDPCVRDSTDAVVQVLTAGICGSDLWFYRGLVPYEPGRRTGHEFVGIVNEVGADVRSLRPGDLVAAPFCFADGSCPECRRGLATSCRNGGYWAGDFGEDGAQSEAVRVPFADENLVPLPPGWRADERRLAAAVLACDVLPTGEHAVGLAAVGPTSDVLVIGDGAVGLAAVIAARRISNGRIGVVGHHEDRLALASKLGASAVLHAAGDSLAEIPDSTFECVVECVGSVGLIAEAVRIVRPGGTVGFVGIPNRTGPAPDLIELLAKNASLRGGLAPARRYMADIIDRMDRDEIPDLLVSDVIDLDDLDDGYRAMDDRMALKTVVRVAS